MTDSINANSSDGRTSRPVRDAGSAAGSRRDSILLRQMLNRRFLIAFSAAVILVVTNQILVLPRLLELTTDAPVINVAGRQRMLSQRLSKSALAYLNADSESKRLARLAELRETLAHWSRSHRGLQQGPFFITNKADASLPGNNSPQVAAAFADLDPFYATMRDAAESLIEGKGDAAAHVQTILANEGEYLPRMDRIVNLYEEEAHEHIQRLEWTGWGLAALVLVALATVGIFVLVPAGNTIERQFGELLEAGDRLEERVRDRTRELQEVNAALNDEHRERLAAEEKQRRLLEQFGRVARINSMGEMASGLAHELNQPLGAVANYVEGCLVHLERGNVQPPKLQATLEKALRSALRAGSIVKRIRMSVMQQSAEKTTITPLQLVTDVADFVEEEAQRRGIRLCTRVAPDLLPIRGDTVQLQQALINFVTNAFDAFEKAAPIQPVVAIEATSSEHGWIELVVEDNGEGVPAEDRKRIFDAFHSTRAHGMGMGLAITRSIVEAHQGSIAVESDVGSGSRFRIQLPSIAHAEPTLSNRSCG